MKANKILSRFIKFIQTTLIIVAVQNNIFAAELTSQADSKNDKLLFNASGATAFSLTNTANQKNPIFGLYIFAMYSNQNDGCDTTNSTTAFYNTKPVYHITSGVATTNTVKFGSSLLYNTIWNALASAQSSISPSQITHIVAAIVTDAPGTNDLYKNSQFSSCPNCGTTANFSHSVVIHDSVTGGRCLTVSCDDSAKSCTINTPNLAINYLQNPPSFPLPGGSWKVQPKFSGIEPYCYLPQSRYDGATLYSVCEYDTGKNHKSGAPIFHSQATSAAVEPNGTCENINGNLVCKNK